MPSSPTLFIFPTTNLNLNHHVRARRLCKSWGRSTRVDGEPRHRGRPGQQLHGDQLPEGQWATNNEVSALALTSDINSGYISLTLAHICSRTTQSS
ncbi:hypothetical protein BDR04DRAFT_1104004 [Suillus decipiens]|nr:hypothetical protein BDR04DRAFT_1104004 [Suillus decipiens]